MRKVYQVTKTFYIDEKREDGFEVGGIYKVKNEEEALKAYKKQYGGNDFLKGCLSDNTLVELI